MTYIVSAFFLLMATGSFGFIDRMIYGDWSGKPGDKLTEAANLFAIIASLLLFWWGTQRLRRPRFNRVLPLMAAGLCVTSVLWSVDPSMTITRSVAYFFVVVGAIGVVEILDAGEVMSLTALIGGFLGAVSLLLFFVRPDTVMSGEDFIGLFSQKNVLGEAMMVGVLAGLHGVRIGGRRRFLYIGITVLCTIVAFLSKSMTSLIAIFVFFVLGFFGKFYIKGGGRRVASICMMIAFISTFILIMMNADLILRFLGKNPTLTGRTDFWPYVIANIYRKPVLGWRFTAFWSPSNPAAMEISYIMNGFNPGEAHNGMLQLLLDVGGVGTVFFLFLWMRNLAMAVKCMNGAAPEIGVSSLLFMVGILVIGVSEQVLVTANGPTVQFFLLGFLCEKELWRARHVRSGVILPSTGLSLDQFVISRGEEAVSGSGHY